MQILEYIEEKYRKTKWPFFSFIELQNKFGTDTKKQLNKLFLDGKIRKRRYINGVLVEYLIT